jgi:hypothetical protein
MRGQQEVTAESEAGATGLTSILEGRTKRLYVLPAFVAQASVAGRSELSIRIGYGNVFD